MRTSTSLEWDTIPTLFSDSKNKSQCEPIELSRVQGRSDRGYIGIYTPKISNRFVHVWDISTCFEIPMTS